MNGSLFVSFLLVLTVLMLTPGPDMLFCLASGLSGGPRAGLLAALGTATGLCVHTVAAAVGLAALFRASPLLFGAVRILGVLYLGWLGLHAFLTRNQRPPRAGGQANAKRAYVRGLVTDLLNPKVAVFMVAFLPAFVDPQAGSIMMQYAVLGACFVAFEVVVDGVVGALAGRFAEALGGPRATRDLKLVAGSAYLGIGTRLALTG